MRCAELARTGYHDVHTLGAGIWRRYLDTLRGRRVTQVNLKGFGPFTVRPRTSDFRVVRQILGDRDYDLSQSPQNEILQATYERILAAGRTPLIIDLGANIGAASLWYSMMYPRARVVAVEPDPSNAELCRHNTAGRNVEVLTAAVGSSPGHVSFLDPGAEKWGFRTARDESGSTPICVVNDIVDAAVDCELFIVKVDIEGFESDLFAANTEWVRKAAAIVIEPHDWMLPGEATSRAFQRLLGTLDYDVLIRGENLVYVRRS